MRESLSYAVVTAARDEEATLPRLAESLRAQTVTPESWVIVENGSTDRTLDTARALAHEESWIDVISVPGSAAPVRGAPIVRALDAGLQVTPRSADIVINVTSGGPGGATDTVSSFIYREYRDRSNVGYGTMLAMVYLVIIIVFITLLLKLVSKRMQRMT